MDLQYPTELHDQHDQYPLAPEHLVINKEMLSDYQKRLAEDLNIKVGGKKLCLTLHDKKEYNCHYRNLKLYLEKGLKIERVKRVLKFNQTPWIRPYIDLNTKLRQEADNKFEEGFAKLVNNSFFGETSLPPINTLLNLLFTGKTCEDVRKYQDFRIVLDGKKANKLISRQTVKRSKIYNENLHQKNVVKMDKPRYIGQSILDISKIVMYNFHYEELS